MKATFGINPWTEMDAIRRELDRALSGYFLDNGQAPRNKARAVFPPVNVSDDGDSLHVVALAPGVDPDSWNVELNDGYLRVTGNRVAADAKPESFHRQERWTGEFSRSIKLPVAVDRDKVSAEYIDGILRIALPKAEIAKPKRVSVSVG
jgi:HSP20 family protein